MMAVLEKVEMQVVGALFAWMPDVSGTLLGMRILTAGLLLGQQENLGGLQDSR